MAREAAYREAERRIEKARRDGAIILYLSSMGLTEVPEAIGQLSGLQVLDLWNNKISKVPEAIGQLSQLQVLNLSYNKISSLPEAIGQLSQLQELNLMGNSISSLPEAIGQLSQLRKLYLMGNSISSLPEEIGQLSQLQVLHLSKNNISSLPEAIGQLSQLQKIYLRDNPLNPELAAAYSQGTEVVWQYLETQRRSQQVVLNEAKLILVGEGEVGKTSLLGALCGDTWKEDRPSTHGIEIKPFTVKVPDRDTEIKLNGWDFGGQPVYRPTHQLFFSAAAVYLVVWKPREGPQQAFIEYWITLIKHRAPEAKIIIVATHGGPNQRQPDIDSHDIITRFGRDTICGFFHVDSKPGATDNHIDELKEAIASLAADLPEVGRKVPAKWQELREKLQATTKAYLSYDEVMALCAAQGMDQSDVNLFLLLSHTLGNLIHYHNDPFLKNIVILKPNWLARAISFVLDDKETRERQGLVDLSRLNQLWHNPEREETERYPLELHPIFRKLMERFDLSYPVVDPSSGKLGETSLIAQLVSDKRPREKLEANWDEKLEHCEEKQQICRIVDENGNAANAEGLFYQLIVRLHKYSLGRANYENSVHWKRGLLLDDDYNGRALLEYRGTDLWITVRAAYPEFLIHELRKEVKWLVESFWKGLKCQVMVPCVAPCGKDQSDRVLFKVERLIKFKNKGQNEYLCDLLGCDEWVNIDNLLRNASSSGSPEVTLDFQQTEKLQDIRQLASQEDKPQYSREQQAILSQIDLKFTQFQQMLLDEAKDGPRLFSFQPLKPGFLDLPKWMGRKYKLSLWCEHSRLPLPVLNPEDPKKGVYELSLPRKWLVKAKPFLKLMTTTLSLVLPVASAATKVVLDEDYDDIEAELELTQETLNATIEGSDRLLEGSEDTPEWEGLDGAVRAEGATLHELHAILKKKDPSFGGLVRVQNKRREFLWVHPRFQYEEEYS